jgi:hypothetical protein
MHALDNRRGAGRQELFMNIPTNTRTAWGGGSRIIIQKEESF